MPDRLTDLTINRVAFVPAGDNPDADIVLWKSKREPITTTDGKSTAKWDPRFTRRRATRLRDGLTAIEAVIEEAGRKEDVVADDTTKQFVLPDDAPEELRKHVEGLQARAEEAESKLEAATKTADKPEDDVTKALDEVPEAVRELVTKLQGEVAKTASESAQAKAEVEKMKTDAEVAQAIAKAESWRYLRVKPAEFGPELQKLRRDNPELATAIEQTLDSANGTSSEAFREIGKGNGADATDAETEFERLVTAEREAHSDLTKEQAFAKVAATPEGMKAYSRIEQDREEG